MLKIEFTKQSDKFLKKLLPKHKRQVSRKIQNLLENPFPNDSRLLKGTPGFYRVDIGEYRICYAVSADVLIIGLVGKRNDDEVYRKFKRLLN
ncbi:MAG: type II toxin-antitoxin system RelE/ParE family toxin [Patescibacteria group bacterium]